MSAELPRNFRSYRFERVLGRGGMGVVYAATDQNLRRRVAIKRVLSDNGDPVRRERLRREARTAAQLTHPAIVQIYDLVEGDEHDWIVMELVEGTLLHQPGSGSLGVEQVLSIGRQVAEGLAAAHALGIVHRDLKAENVVLLPDGRIKILDFGLAKKLAADEGETSLEELSRPGQVLGTGRAMSPEQARGLRVGPRSDLFSLGVLLYELSTGVSPFRGLNLFDTLTRIATHHPTPVAELDPAWPLPFSDLVTRLLEKAPEQRPASARQVATRLSRITDQRRVGSFDSVETLDPIAETPTSGPAAAGPSASSMLTLPRLGSRTGGLAALAAAGALIVILGIVLPRTETPRAPPQAASTETDEARPLEDSLRLYEEGMRAVRRNDRPESLEQAVEIFQGMLEADATSAPGHAGLARAYWEKARNVAAGGDPVFLEQALSVAQRATELNPYLADARVSYGLARLHSGDPAGARQELENALELEPGNADAHFGLAKLAESAGDLEASESSYRRAFELLPTPLYANALGAQLYRAGRYEEAEEWFSTSLELSPQNLYALRNLGGLHHAQGRSDEAARRFQQALVVRPDASLYSNLGTVFFGRGLYPLAAGAFEDALAMPGATNRSIYWSNLADAYRLIPGQQTDAQRAYRQALRILDQELAAAPGDLRVASRRVLVMARSGHAEEARAELVRRSPEASSTDLYSRLRFAIAHELCGNRQQALDTLTTALRDGLPLSEVRREPDLQALHADPGFHELLLTFDER